MGESHLHQHRVGLYMQSVRVYTQPEHQPHCICIGFQAEGLDAHNWLTPEQACQLAQRLLDAARAAAEVEDHEQEPLPF